MTCVTHPLGRRIVALMQLMLDGATPSFLKWEKVGELEHQKEALRRYTLPDGQVFDEAIQYADTQRMIVLVALKDQQGNWIPDSLWSEEAVEYAKKLNDISDPT